MLRELTQLQEIFKQTDEYKYGRTEFVRGPNNLLHRIIRAVRFEDWLSHSDGALETTETMRLPAVHNK